MTGDDTAEPTPWIGDDGPAYFEPAEQADGAWLQLRVTPEVQVLVNSSYQLAVTVKGGTPAVITASVLLDAVTFASQWIDSHQPHAGDPG